MGDYVERDMCGSMFVNQYKSKEGQPDFQGTVTIKGEQFKLAGWRKDGKKGEFTTLKVQTAEEAAKYAKKEKPSQSSDQDDANLPF